MSKWKIAGINFDHLHMGDNLRMAFEHADVEIVGICDEQPERMRQACEDFAIPADRVFTDYQACLEKTQPDIVLLCPATAEHGEWTEKVAPFGVHIIMEKPFAATLAEADQMQRAMEGEGRCGISPTKWSARPTSSSTKNPRVGFTKRPRVAAPCWTT